MDRRFSIPMIPEILSRLLFRLRTGRWGRFRGVGIGFAGAAILFMVGFFLGRPLAELFSLLAPLRFTSGDLTVLWGVHATIITLSLVGLSFAWNSIRNLPTRHAIIAEIAFKLRSIETIAFLLTANVLIGVGVILTTGDVVSTKIGGSAGALLLGSILLTVVRFWLVFDLLLHNKLDLKVFHFAEASLAGTSYGTESEYEEYLGHFFDGCHREIDSDRPERLREQLSGIETLLDKVFAAETAIEEDPQFWEYVFGRYETIYRRSITQQNSPLERQVTDSLSVVFQKTLRHGDSDLVQRVFQYFITLSARGYSLDPGGSATESLLEHFEIAQRQILSEFAQAEDADSLAETTARVDGLLDTHRELWRIAVEHEDGRGLEYLHHMLDEPHQFRRHEYAPPPEIREQRDIPEDSIEALKQDHAASYRNAITNLRYATYGWAFNLYEEGDCSAGFINHIFSEYVEDDFGSVDKLSEQYFVMRDATEPMNSWERWNIERELNRNYGVASTGMAVHTWLLRFCCAALIWILDEQEIIASFQDRDPVDSPLTEYERVQKDVDRIEEQLESYRDGYPLNSLIDDNPSTEDRCNSLLEYFEGVKSVLDEQEQAWIRTLPISDQIVSGYEDQVNSQLDSADFRTALETVGSIDQEETMEKDANATFSVEATAPRRLFVDDGRQTVFQSPHRDLIERYRRLVLGKLNLREQKVGSASDIPDALAELIKSEEVALLVCEHMEVGRILRNDERTKRSSNDVAGSHIDFMGIPVLRDVTNEFAAIALYEGKFYYGEENDGGPIKVDVTPGEDVDQWDPDEYPDKDIRDYVKITYSYRAHIESSVGDGVIFRISS